MASRTFTWDRTAGSTGNWTLPANWDLDSGYPGDSVGVNVDTVIIPADTDPCQVDAAIQCYKVTLSGNNADWDVNLGNNLTVDLDLLVQSGKLVIDSHTVDVTRDFFIMGSGTVDAGTGTILVGDGFMNATILGGGATAGCHAILSGTSYDVVCSAYFNGGSATDRLGVTYLPNSGGSFCVSGGNGFYSGGGFCGIGSSGYSCIYHQGGTVDIKFIDNFGGSTAGSITERNSSSVLSGFPVSTGINNLNLYIYSGAGAGDNPGHLFTTANVTVNGELTVQGYGGTSGSFHVESNGGNAHSLAVSGQTLIASGGSILVPQTDSKSHTFVSGMRIGGADVGTDAAHRAFYSGSGLETIGGLYMEAYGGFYKASGTTTINAEMNGGSWGPSDDFWFKLDSSTVNWEFSGSGAPTMLIDGTDGPDRSNYFYVTQPPLNSSFAAQDLGIFIENMYITNATVNAYSKNYHLRFGSLIISGNSATTPQFKTYGGSDMRMDLGDVKVYDGNLDLTGASFLTATSERGGGFVSAAANGGFQQPDNKYVQPLSYGNATSGYASQASVNNPYNNGMICRTMFVEAGGTLILNDATDGSVLAVWGTDSGGYGSNTWQVIAGTFTPGTCAVYLRGSNGRPGISNVASTSFYDLIAHRPGIKTNPMCVNGNMYVGGLASNGNPSNLVCSGSVYLGKAMDNGWNVGNLNTSATYDISNNFHIYSGATIHMASADETYNIGGSWFNSDNDVAIG